MKRGIWSWLGWGSVICVLLLRDAQGVKNIPPDMVKIPAGWFIMGSDIGPEDAQPAHRVYLATYFIDKYEVTNAQYKKYRDERLAERKKGKEVRMALPYCEVNAPPEARQLWNITDGTYPLAYANHPVTCLPWDAANEYCKGIGKELPTEAQWEKAARGANGLAYPWGNEWEPSYNNHGFAHAPWEDASDGYGRTAPVGSLPKDVSPYGVYDMGGNVWEWTRDIYSKSYYKWAPTRNPPGPTLKTLPVKELSIARDHLQYVHKGGSWVSGPEKSLSYFRFPRPIVYRDDAGGFRCVKELK